MNNKYINFKVNSLPYSEILNRIIFSIYTAYENVCNSFMVVRFVVFYQKVVFVQLPYIPEYKSRIFGGFTNIKLGVRLCT